MASNTAEQRWTQLQDHNFGMYLVVTQNNSFSPPNKADCAKVQQQYGLTMPVLYDPTGALQGAMGLSSSNDQSLVFSKGLVTEMKAKYANQNTVGNLLSELLGL